MTSIQLNSKKYILDYLTPEEREDPIINNGIQAAKKLTNACYFICNSQTELGMTLDQIDAPNEYVIIHFLSHGCKYGLGRTSDNFYTEVIHWELLLKSLETVTNRCQQLSVNLTAVCSSYSINQFNPKPYDKIWTIDGEADSISKSVQIYSSQEFSDITYGFPNSASYYENEGSNK